MHILSKSNWTWDDSVSMEGIFAKLCYKKGWKSHTALAIISCFEMVIYLAIAFD